MSIADRFKPKDQTPLDRKTRPTEPVPKPAAKAGEASKRGRPRIEAPKEAVTLRLDPATVARFKETGTDWRSRMSDALDATKL